MQVPPEELQRYTDYAVQVALRLRAADIDPNQILWHYTNGQGLLGILSTHTLYSTQVACLNDATEIRYASLIFRQALSRLLQKRLEDDSTLKFLSEALNYFGEDPATPNHVALPYFVSCFSKVRDDLSQWRAYGGGENGYAVGFKAKHLVGTPFSYLARVTYYEVEEHEPLVDEVAAQTLSFFKEGLNRFGTSSPSDWTEAFLERWDEAITQVAPLVKHSAFAGENEVRIIRTYRSEDVPNLVFHQKSSMLTTHLPIQPGEQGPERYRLPISEIVIGPCRHPQVSRISVGTLLQKADYTASVNLSTIPFQLT